MTPRPSEAMYQVSRMIQHVGSLGELLVLLKDGEKRAISESNPPANSNGIRENRHHSPGAIHSRHWISHSMIMVDVVVFHSILRGWSAPTAHINLVGVRRLPASSSPPGYPPARQSDEQTSVSYQSPHQNPAISSPRPPTRCLGPRPDHNPAQDSSTGPR